jgi:valyl-tRNA synthetase
VEYSKQVFYGTDEGRKQDVLNVMHHVFSNSLRLLHPLMPFLTEELWHGMGYNQSSETIMRAPWPKSVDVKSLGIDSAVVDYVDARHELIRIARTLKTDSGVAPAQKVAYTLKPVSEQYANQSAADQATIVALLRCGEFTIDAAFAPAKAMPSALTPLGTVYMSLEGAVDAEAEAKKLSAQLAEVDENLKRVAQKLDNESFVSKAPAAVVDQQRAKKQELLEKRGKLEKLIEAVKK